MNTHNRGYTPLPHASKNTREAKSFHDINCARHILIIPISEGKVPHMGLTFPIEDMRYGMIMAVSHFDRVESNVLI